MYNSFMNVEKVNELGVAPLKGDLAAIAALNSASGVSANKWANYLS